MTSPLRTGSLPASGGEQGLRPLRASERMERKQTVNLFLLIGGQWFDSTLAHGPIARGYHKYLAWRPRS